MKRYWKILLVSVMTVVVIGAFYIQSSLAANNHAQFTIETISGDKKIGEKMMISGDYILGDDFHQSLLITEQETINPANLSIFEQLKSSYSLLTYKDLISRHKSFLRGKDLSLNNFYEDEEILAYVDIKKDEFYGNMKNATFIIDVFDKRTNQSIDKKLKFQDKSKFDWVNLRDIQATNGELKVLVEGHLHAGGMEMNIYSFSLEDLQLINTESIIEAKYTENEHPHIYFLNNSYSKNKDKYFLFLKDTDIYTEENGESHKKATEYEVFSYSLSDNQLKTVSVPESLIPFLTNGNVSDSSFYVPVELSEGSYEIHRYHFEKEKWDEKRLYSIPNIVEGTAPFMKLENGQIYFVYAVEDGYTIFIADLDTGKTIYEGKMKVANQKEKQKDYYLFVHDMELY